MAEPSSVEGLLETAWQMRWRVPELALVLSDGAVTFARRTGDQGARLRAEALALFAANRLGRGVPATGRALAAIRDAEASGGDVLTRLRIELGWCAVSAGSHEVAVRILRRELAHERVEPAVRAHALLALASALPAHQDLDERSQALDEAERLYASCDADEDLTRVLKARVWVVRAAHCRRLGEFGDAVAATDAGMELLRRLSDPEAEAGEIQTRLLLERVHALLDQGHRVEAVETSQAVLAEPVRAAAAGPTGWLGLALATRVHLPTGDHEAALRVLAETAAISKRHKLDGLLAEALNALSRAHESVEEVAEALQALRGAYSADRRWRAAVHNARVSLLSAYPPETDAPSGRRTHVAAAVPDPVAAAPVAPVVAEPVVPEPEPAPPEPAVTSHDETASEPLRPEPVVAEPSAPKRGGYAGAPDSARLLLEALTSRGAKEAEDAEPATAAEQRIMPEPRVAFDAVSPSEMFGSGLGGPASQSSNGSWWPSSESEHSRTTAGYAEAHEFDADHESGGYEDHYGDDDPSQRWSGDPLAAAVDSLRRITEAHDRREHTRGPKPATPPHGFPAQESPEEVPERVVDDVPQGGRRSRGKSLAEIRAELQLPADHQPSRRRARHADPDPLAVFRPEQINAEPEPPASAPSSTTTAAGADYSSRSRAPEPDPAPPEPSPDASLADLLADALMAYNAGRTDEAKQQVSEGIAAIGYGDDHNAGRGEPGYGDRRSHSKHADQDTGDEAGHNRYQSTEDDRRRGFGARHRAPGIGSAAVDPLL
ncbi:hypothetical protein E1161_07365 [Saccharopolyspora aridisoli]|uniref:Tetratricopeptide repeat protein n=1 Tax=Saccharopolyspora aridisoli TaxID=2530385 RepID=A0A4R4UR15_9PSEU|nr:hypothetical protein [Saccharopolyspora aridisoli]TDC94360.1 hypothetical protein E1161_07365 [Saccharopolyspora aridisoli]